MNWAPFSNCRCMYSLSSNPFQAQRFQESVVHTEVSIQHLTLSRTLLIVIMERDKGKKTHRIL